MIPTITINGKALSTFGLTPLDGTLDALMKPAPMKQLVYNDNATMDGSRAITTGRRMQRRDVSLTFLLNATSLQNLADMTDVLIEELIAGKSDSGINEIAVHELERKYNLVYQSYDSYNNFDRATKVTLRIKFTELNPRNNK